MRTHEIGNAEWIVWRQAFSDQSHRNHMSLMWHLKRIAWNRLTWLLIAAGVSACAWVGAWSVAKAVYEVVVPWVR